MTLPRKAARLIALLAVLLPVSLAANDFSPAALIEGGHWKRLHALAEQGLRANPNDAHANYLLAYAKFEYGNYDAAQSLAEKAVKLDGSKADYHFILGAIYGRKAENTGNPFTKWSLAGKVKKEFETAASLDPSHVMARMALIDFHLSAPGMVGGDKDRARALADEILRIDPARGWLAKARIARKRKQTAQLESLYQQAVQAPGESYAASMALSNFYASGEQKKYDLAEKHARDALAATPGRVGAYAQLAAIYAEQQRWKELDEILARAEKAVPDDLSPYFHAGRVLVQINRDPQRAEQYLRKYVTQPPEPNAPSLGAGHWRLGQALEKQGRADEARRAYQDAVALDPKLDEAKKDLRRLR
ncbi:MAG: tetratricopeptide repeat protein [Candidatus Acidiferrales bacterium]